MPFNLNPERKSIILYAAKCVTGWLLVYGFSLLFNYPEINWALISIILVLSPDEGEAVTLAITRIKANLLGASASLLCLLMGQPNVITIGVAFIVAIGLCYLFNLITASRTALAAVIIVMLQYTGGIQQPHFWSVAFERIVAVGAGCAVGLLITLVFHGSLKKSSDDETTTKQEA